MKYMRLICRAVLLLGSLGTISLVEAAASEDVKLGVLTDLSSVYSDSSGNGAIFATQMAVEDMKDQLGTRRVEVTT